MGMGEKEKKKRMWKSKNLTRKIIKKKKKNPPVNKILNFPPEIRRDINCGFLLQGINETLLFTGEVKCTRLLKSAHASHGGCSLYNLVFPVSHPEKY